MNSAIYVSRESIDKLLAGNPTPEQLKCRAGIVRRLAEDCGRFFPWPALHASLTDDVKRLMQPTPLKRS